MARAAIELGGDLPFELALAQLRDLHFAVLKAPLDLDSRYALAELQTRYRLSRESRYQTQRADEIRRELYPSQAANHLRDPNQGYWSSPYRSWPPPGQPRPQPGEGEGQNPDGRPEGGDDGHDGGYDGDGYDGGGYDDGGYDGGGYDGDGGGNPPGNQEGEPAREGWRSTSTF